MRARSVLAFPSVLFLLGLAAGACGVDPGSNFPDDGGPGSSGNSNGGSSGNQIQPGDGSPGTSSGSPDGSIRPLAVEPATATIVVRKINGVISREPENIQFTAKRDGTIVPDARWFLQQGELGAIDAATGVFVPSGNSAGAGTVIATANGGTGQAQVVVSLEGEQNGGSSDGSVDGCGAGGCGGVGGEPLGGAVSAEDLERLKTQAPDASDGSFAWLYPYDKTVFPRGILAPLLQWDWAPTAKAVSVKVSSPGVSFTGYYQYANDAAAVARERVRVDQAVWRSALQANDGGNFLEIEVKLLADDNKVYGPFKRQFIVSPAPLTGTVYYNSYNSRLTGQGTESGELGGVLSIRVTSNDPAVAAEPQPTLPARLQGEPAQRKCTGCHVVSADGSSLFVQDGQHDPNPLHIDYPRSMWFDLRQEPLARGDGSATSLDPTATPADANKFLWSAPYPDGSFVLASTGLSREARLAGPSALFGKDGAAVAASGLPEDLWASTPTFSPDGRHVAFNFFQGTIPEANAGARSLVVYDFSCGAADGQVACNAAEAKAFSNPRTVYSAADRYPAWPSFFADGNGVVFQNATGNAGQLYKDSYSSCTPYNEAPKTAATGSVGGTANRIPGSMNCHIATWYGQDAEVWLAPDGGEAVPLYALNGSTAEGVSYLPEHRVAQAAGSDYWRATPQPNSRTYDDTKLNYQPTVNPVPSGGYYWVVFTSRRRYGNVMNQHPFHRADNNFPIYSNQKKLWVAAVNANTGAIDRSHPAFYLPGQELQAGNSRGFWAVDPCRPTGDSCETGDQCCAGSCRGNEQGQLTCQPPPVAECKPEFDACTSDADCCGDRLTCINGRCAVRGPKLPN